MPKKINTEPPMSEADTIAQLIKTNQDLVLEVHRLTKKVQWFLWASQIKTVIWLLIIIGSVVATVIYLPPLMQNFVNSYQGLLSGLN